MGKTEGSLKLRVLEHGSRIRLTAMDAPMVSHFVPANHKGIDLRFTLSYIAGKNDTQIDLLKHDVLDI